MAATVAGLRIGVAALRRHPGARMEVDPDVDLDGIAVGAPADLVVLDAPDALTALRTVAPVLAAYKRGRRTVTREPVRLPAP